LLINLLIRRTFLKPAKKAIIALELKKMAYKTFSLVVRGELRRRVLIVLYRCASSPSLLSLTLKKNRASVSRALSYLKKLRLIECINPEDKKGKVYVITEEGKKIAEQILDTLKNINEYDGKK
jgi:DNA-binding MarR family transcriptional regulator